MLKQKQILLLMFAFASLEGFITPHHRKLFHNQVFEVRAKVGGESVDLSLSPDRNLFKAFFASSSAEGGMSIDQLRKHDDLSIMLSQGDVSVQKVYKIWLEIAGIESYRVDEGTAYAILTKTMQSANVKAAVNSVSNDNSNARGKDLPSFNISS